MGIIERLFHVWVAGLMITVAGILVWRYLGPPALLIEPHWWNIAGYPIPRVSWIAQNFGQYEQVNIERNVNGQWVPITSTPLRANAWGFVEYITPPNPDTSGFQIGTTVEYRAIGLESGKLAYQNVIISNQFP